MLHSQRGQWQTVDDFAFWGNVESALATRMQFRAATPQDTQLLVGEGTCGNAAFVIQMNVELGSLLCQTGHLGGHHGVLLVVERLVGLLIGWQQESYLNIIVQMIMIF